MGEVVTELDEERRRRGSPGGRDDSPVLEIQSAAAIALIQSHYRMQRGEFIAELNELDSAGAWVRSETTAAPMWNQACWWGENSESLMETVVELKRLAERQNRRPILYLPSFVPSETSAALEKAGFERFDREAWMLFEGNGGHKANDGELKIERVQSREQLIDFISVFNDSYRIRGEAYGKALERSFERGRSDNAVVRHYIGYAGGQPVTIGTAIQEENRCCLYNVGTVSAARRRGFGRILTERMLRESLEAGADEVFLQADAGSATERLYEKMGFQRAFTRAGYRLKEWQETAGADDRSGDEVLSLVNALSHLKRAKNVAAGRASYSVRIEGDVAKLLESRDRGQEERALTLAGVAWALFLARCGADSLVEFGLRGPSGENRPIRLELQRQNEIGELTDEIARQLRAPARTNDSLPETRLEWAGAGRDQSAAEALRAIIDPAGGQIEFHYSTGAFESGALERFLKRFPFVLSQVLLQPNRQVGSIKLLSEEEEQRTIHDWNKDDFTFDPNLTIRALFEERCASQPERLAVALARHSGAPIDELNYGQLNERANRWAHRLRDLGVGPETFVAVCLERSVEMIVVLLGIHKAGGAFVPLDPEYPQVRLDFILKETGAPVVITESGLGWKFREQEIRVVDVDASEDQQILAQAPQANPEWNFAGSDLAYAIYTSGSTGQPKGALIENAVLANHAIVARNHYQLNERDRALQFSALNFDAALEQIFPVLISGGAVIVRGPEVWSARQFSERLETLALTVVDVPNAYWRSLAIEWKNDGDRVKRSHLRLVIIGGEAMSPETLALWRETPARDVRLINAYGPTEAAITAAAFEAGTRRAPGDGGRVPIGRRFGGRKLYILDAFGDPVAEGVPGELCIGGEMLARGYLNRPEVTSSRFVLDPFAGGRGRMYRTGDLACYLPDGVVDFLGRADQQVKIRGFRIELGEIENVLHEYPSVRQAVVTARGEGHEKELAAYVALHPGDSFQADALREFVSGRLPEYMVPTRWKAMPSMPLLASGKIDRKSLPPPDEEMSAAGGKAPETPLQLQLQLVFERVLKRREISVDASFFELGGNSLQALELIMEIEKAIGTELPLGTLYQASSVEALAETLSRDEGGEAWSALAPLQPRGERPPFFLIHTTPGDILAYGGLVYHLGLDQPCHGIQSRGLGSVEESQTNVEEMAAYYVDLVRSKQPRGPYYLGGWCYGGLVAVEMGRLLKAQGEEVGMLALMERVALPPSWKNLKYYLHRGRRLLAMKPGQWARYLWEKIRYMKSSKEADKMRFRQARESDAGDGEGVARRERRLAQLEHVYRANMQALKEYRPAFYDGKVTLFNAAEQEASIIPDPLCAWPGLAASIETHVTPGDHDSMLAEPHVKVLAAKVRACLDRAMAERRR